MSARETRRGDVVETLHGHQIADPYRWLEDPDSAETTAWVARRTRRRAATWMRCASRPWFLRPLREIVSRPRGGTPERMGGRYVVSRNDGSQEQDVWFVGETLDELVHESRLLLDPNSFSEDGTSSLVSAHASRDGRWLAYLVSDGGSDWTTIRLLELGSGREVDDVLEKVKFSEATWLPDHASYLYLHFETTGSGVGTEAAALPGGRLMRHRVGSPRTTTSACSSSPTSRGWSSSRRSRTTAVGSRHTCTAARRRRTGCGCCRSPPRRARARSATPVKLVDDEYAGFTLVRTDGSGGVPAHRPRGAAAASGAASTSTPSRARAPSSPSTWCRSPSTCWSRSRRRATSWSRCTSSTHSRGVSR